VHRPSILGCLVPRRTGYPAVLGESQKSAPAFLQLLNMSLSPWCPYHLPRPRAAKAARVITSRPPFPNPSSSMNIPSFGRVRVPQDWWWMRILPVGCTTLRPLARLVACPLPAFPCEGKRCRNYRSAATAFTTFCTLLRGFDTPPLAGLYSLVLVR
jgi:hypothetical protein